MPNDRCKVPFAFWRAVEGLDIPPPALLRQARLPATLHLAGPAWLSTTQYFALMRALEQLAGRSALGILMVQRADTATHPPSSLAAFHARDYRDGITRLARFKALCTPEVIDVRETGADCVVTLAWLHAQEPAPAIAIDITFATLVELARRATGLPITPRRVDVARSGAADPQYEQYFGCPVRYGAAQDALILDRADLDRPFPGHNPELLAMLTPALNEALGELEANATVADQVRTVLKRSLASGRPDLADIAQQLNMSERTLQRRITEEGSRFRDLLVDARQDVGRMLLADPDTDMTEVACLLGYQDTSSFYRAFREWEGMTPGRWRRTHGATGVKMLN